MIECIFTIDYEIYGNGTGSVKELIYDPAERLIKLFKDRGVRFVPYIEVAELELIESEKTDPAIDLVEEQIRRLHRDGFELGLHLHPQWYNAKYRNGVWHLDYTEYNLCTLQKERIHSIVSRALAYLRRVLGEPEFTPLSFRAGNWLFQPTETAAAVLASEGIKVDSSVFKGGLQHNQQLDYRRARRNGHYWQFRVDANIPDSQGTMLEIPIYTEMVPFWKMITSKRISMQKKSASAYQAPNRKSRPWRDYLRLLYPLKFDFCRMTLQELVAMTERLLARDARRPEKCLPMVAIGHTKDSIDLETVGRYLDYLERKGIAVSTFGGVLSRLELSAGQADRAATSPPAEVLHR